MTGATFTPVTVGVSDPHRTADEVISVLAASSLNAAALTVWGRRLEQREIDEVVSLIRSRGWTVHEEGGKIRRDLGHLDEVRYR